MIAQNCIDCITQELELNKIKKYIIIWIQECQINAKTGKITTVYHIPINLILLKIIHVVMVYDYKIPKESSVTSRIQNDSVNYDEFGQKTA